MIVAGFNNIAFPHELTSRPELTTGVYVIQNQMLYGGSRQYEYNY